MSGTGIPNASQTVAIFDFDKTLITEDSFLRFSLLASRRPAARIAAFGLAFLCKFGFISNDRYKAEILDRFWISRSDTHRHEILLELQQWLHDRVRSGIVQQLRRHVDAGDRVIVMSASPFFYLGPFITGLFPEVKVIGSEMTTRGTHVDIDNVYGERKAELARELLENEAAIEVLVYTDSLSDLALMSLATKIYLVKPSSGCIAQVRRHGLDFEVFAG